MNFRPQSHCSAVPTAPITPAAEAIAPKLTPTQVLPGAKTTAIAFDTFTVSPEATARVALAPGMDASIISNSGGTILSNNGANLVSRSGGAILSNNGANVTGGGGGGGVGMIIVQPTQPVQASATGNPIMDFWKNLIAPIRGAAQEIVNWVQQVIDATKPQA